MPLTLLPVGDTAPIKRITGCDATRARLSEMGFVVGALVQVVAHMGGNLIISIKGSRVALGRDMACRIII